MCLNYAAGFVKIVLPLPPLKAAFSNYLFQLLVQVWLSRKLEGIRITNANQSSYACKF